MLFWFQGDNEDEVGVGNLSAPSQDIPANVSSPMVVMTTSPKLCVCINLWYSIVPTMCTVPLSSTPPDGRGQSHAKKYESVREGSVIGWMHAI